MKFRTLIIGYVLVLAVFLFAKRHSDPSPQSSNFSKVVDLTRPNARTIDQIPAVGLTAPLVVLDVRSNAKNNPGYQISVEDLQLCGARHKANNAEGVFMQSSAA